MPYKKKSDQKKYHREYRKRNPEKTRANNHKSALRKSLELVMENESVMHEEKEIFAKLVNMTIKSIDEKLGGKEHEYKHSNNKRKNDKTRRIEVCGF